jgi:hypothetical protein
MAPEIALRNLSQKPGNLWNGIINSTVAVKYTSAVEKRNNDNTELNISVTFKLSF